MTREGCQPLKEFVKKRNTCITNGTRCVLTVFMFLLSPFANCFVRARNQDGLDFFVERDGQDLVFRYSRVTGLHVYSNWNKSKSDLRLFMKYIKNCLIHFSSSLNTHYKLRDVQWIWSMSFKSNLKLFIPTWKSSNRRAKKQNAWRLFSILVKTHEGSC